MMIIIIIIRRRRTIIIMIITVLIINTKNNNDNNKIIIFNMTPSPKYSKSITPRNVSESFTVGFLVLSDALSLADLVVQPLRDGLTPPSSWSPVVLLSLHIPL